MLIFFSVVLYLHFSFTYIFNIWRRFMRPFLVLEINCRRLSSIFWKWTKAVNSLLLFCKKSTRVKGSWNFVSRLKNTREIFFSTKLCDYLNKLHFNHLITDQKPDYLWQEFGKWSILSCDTMVFFGFFNFF